MILIQHLIDALSLGSIYALTALGIGLIFGVVRLVNFAHSEYITIGAYALIIPSTDAVARLGLGAAPPLLVLFGVIAVSAGLAVLSSLLVFRRFSNASPSIMMVGSFALGYVMQNTVLLLYGSRPKSVGLWSELGRTIQIFDIHIPILQLIILFVSLALLIGLTLFLNYTFIGTQLRCAAEDFRMARLLGVRASRLITIAFAISGMLAGFVSLVLVVQGGVVSYRMGLPVVLIAFIATVIGGMGSLQGAVVGGLLMGLVSVSLQVFLPLELKPFRDAFVFLAVMLLLVFRPSGIIRNKALDERV